MTPPVTPAVTWDPAQYLRHADHRSRPFHELVDRVPGVPTRIVDLGCGPGNTTATLTDRWPGASVTGIDNSAPMIDKARRDHPGTAFGLGDITGYDPAADGPAPDLILSNAALQWVPGHADLFPRWIEALPVGGSLAFQVPGNFGEPTHTLLTALRTGPRWAARLADLSRPGVLHPADYLARLSALGCTVDAWETTYYQVLQGEDPVLDWMLGTGLRPSLDALPDPAERAEFLAEYSAALAEAYPATPHGTVLPYRRVFVVATKG
ncbi:methyltransferase domain-containing protein [Streptacidiphilus cavernicola]|uniref:Methyltransferase domain-containing protein n=1 Tax=Streptacidiphilus cavernicola TaxID=3342716 RepID=A0ABV6VNJ5_9ACTN